MMMAIPYTELHNSKIRCQQASLLRVEDFSKLQNCTLFSENNLLFTKRFDNRSFTKLLNFFSNAADLY